MVCGAGEIHSAGQGAGGGGFTVLGSGNGWEQGSFGWISGIEKVSHLMASGKYNSIITSIIFCPDIKSVSQNY